MNVKWQKKNSDKCHVINMTNVTTQNQNKDYNNSINKKEI